jgi:alpha-glucoside transport system ATP-binding protein
MTTVALANGGTATTSVPTTEADMGRKVNIGVRPEDFVEAEGAMIYEGRVNITEALGEVTLLYFDRVGEGEPVIAKLPGIHKGLRGTAVRLTADPAKVHLFADGHSLLYR